jgi:DNA (cytosine-5)-methyltransferase 1
MLRVIQEAKPTWIIGENVAGIVNLALDQVCADLEGQGYEVEPIIVPACAVDAPHRRDRVWILAHSKRDGQSPSKERGGIEEAVRLQQNRPHDAFNTTRASNLSSTEHDVADSEESRLEGRDFEGASHMEGRPWEGCATIKTNWLAEPNVGRVANGIPNRSHRLKGLGNAIVPQVASEIIRCINKIMEKTK